MTPKQNAMICFVFSAALDIEIGFAIPIIGFLVSCLRDFVKWACTRHCRKHEAHEFSFPKRKHDYNHPGHQEEE